MNTIARLVSHSSVQLRLLSLVSSGILLAIGHLLGFASWTSLALGGIAGFLLGLLFWYETRASLYRERQFPVTATQKLAHCCLFVLYAVFIGCIIERVQQNPSPPWTRKLLEASLNGLIGFVGAYTFMQLLRLWHYLLHGGVLDRFIWRERQTGKEGMIGRTGIVRERLDPAGKIFIRGELWDAVVEGGEAVEVGEPVVTVRMVGLKMFVRPVRPDQEDGSLPGPV